MPELQEEAMTRLTFGDYRECAGCSKGVHTEHVDVHCDCSLCKEPS